MASDVLFFERRVDVVLLELLADEWLKDCHFNALKEYKNANGDRILVGHANGSVSFQTAQSLNQWMWCYGRGHEHKVSFMHAREARVKIVSDAGEDRLDCQAQAAGCYGCRCRCHC